MLGPRGDIGLQLGQSVVHFKLLRQEEWQRNVQSQCQCTGGLFCSATMVRSKDGGRMVEQGGPVVEFGNRTGKIRDF
jgi:hypothetical protein